MAIDSTALSPRPSLEGKTEPPPQTERSRPSDRRIPAARDAMATLPDGADAFGFEPHDTIPAPPWLEDGPAEETSP